jgi:serine/threonine-protein phosphatase 2A regulatory subunit A
MSESVANDIDAFALFKGEMASSELTIRIYCVRNMDVIAFALGKECTEAQLIPHLLDCVKGTFGSDDDEILLAIAKHIVDLVPMLPAKSGPACVVSILEILASQDETVIREAAVASLCKLAGMSADICNQACLPALLRLFKADWFSQRLSACGLAASVYPHGSPESREQIRSFYISCATDELPMVKRAAAVHLCEMISVAEKEFVITELVPIYKVLAQDDTQDSVRSSCVATSVALCKIFDSDEIRAHVRDTVAGLAVDKSWRVRLAVVKVYSILCSLMGKDSTISHLIEPLVALMKDQEPDVRKAAVVAFQSTAGVLTPALVTTHFVPLFSVVSKDPVQQVRSALSECIGPLARVTGRDFTLAHMLPLLMDSVKDEHPTIRYNSTSAIATICEIVKDSEPVVSQLTALLQSLSHDTNWRTRLGVLEQIAPLCRLFGKETYQNTLENLFLSFYGDSVSAVREAMSVEIGKLVEFLGEEWTVSHLVPKILSLYSETNSYTSRIAILHTIPRLATVFANDSDIETLLLPTVLLGCKDSVANVRFVACAVAEELSKRSSDVKGNIRASVEPLLTDADIDVRYFASRAIA